MRKQRIFQQRQTSEAGFTLVELIVVMVIVAILMGAGFMGLLSWLGTDNVNVTQARVRSALQTTMADALTHPPALSSPYGNWSLQIVTQGNTQELYVCTGAHGGCAGNPSNPAAGPVMVHVSEIPTSVHVTINGTALSCLAFNSLGQPLLQGAPATASAHICYWPTAINGQWTFQTLANGGSKVSSSYVF